MTSPIRNERLRCLSYWIIGADSWNVLIHTHRMHFPLSRHFYYTFTFSSFWGRWRWTAELLCLQIRLPIEYHSNRLVYHYCFSIGCAYAAHSWSTCRIATKFGKRCSCTSAHAQMVLYAVRQIGNNHDYIAPIYSATFIQASATNFHYSTTTLFYLKGALTTAESARKYRTRRAVSNGVLFSAINSWTSTAGSYGKQCTCSSKVVAKMSIYFCPSECSTSTKSIPIASAGSCFY